MYELKKLNYNVNITTLLSKLCLDSPQFCNGCLYCHPTSNAYICSMSNSIDLIITLIFNSL